MTPKTAMREAATFVIPPRPSQETIKILKNKKAQQKRIQSKNGEVVTTEDVKKRLRLEVLKEKLKLKQKTKSQKPA